MAGLAAKRVKIGLETLQTDLPTVLRRARVGLLAHAASRLPTGEHALEVLRRSGLNVVRLFGPEHGFFGAAAAGENVADTVYGGLPLVSLYGSRRAPGPEHLRDLDALVFDVQDVGVRAYTYLSTLKACLSACAQTGVLLVVLERPNPLGRAVYGAGVSAGFESFVSAHNVPFVYGLTLGELAVLIARDLELEASLHVVNMVGYDGFPWAETGLPWRAPSPNLPRLRSAQLYPLTVFLEGTPLSEGRGTDSPFEQLGAPWLDGKALAERLGESSGLRAEPVWFTPVSSKYAGVEVSGVKLSQTGPVDPLRAARVLLSEVRRQNSGFSWLGDERPFIDLLAGSEVLRRTVDGELGEEAFTAWLGEGRGLELDAFNDD